MASARIPRIIAITNKFAVSAEQRQSASASVIRTYQIPSDLSVIVNSSPYVLHQHRVGGDNSSITQDKLGVDVVERRMANLNRLIAAPISLIQLPFRRKDMVLPIEGVKNLRDLVNRVLLEHEDATLRVFNISLFSSCVFTWLCMWYEKNLFVCSVFHSIQGRYEESLFPCLPCYAQFQKHFFNIYSNIVSLLSMVYTKIVS